MKYPPDCLSKTISVLRAECCPGSDAWNSTVTARHIYITQRLPWETERTLKLFSSEQFYSISLPTYASYILTKLWGHFNFRMVMNLLVLIILFMSYYSSSLFSVLSHSFIFLWLIFYSIHFLPFNALFFNRLTFFFFPFLSLSFPYLPILSVAIDHLLCVLFLSRILSYINRFFFFIYPVILYRVVNFHSLHHFILRPGCSG